MKDSENEDAIKAQFEIDFLNFNINENKLSFLYSGTNDKGEPYEYPSLKLFTDETYNYLLDRQKKAKAENLKSRYSHILWLSPKKKIEHGQTAIDCYLKLIKIREKQDVELPEEHFGLKVLEDIKNAFFLSLSIKYKVDKIKKEIIRIIKKYSEKSSSSYALRFQLIKVMLNNKATFESSDFKGIISICEKMFTQAYSFSKNSSIDVLYLIIKVAEKLQSDTIKYQRRIAELWEELSYDREDGTNIISTDFCRNAIKIYKKLKDTKKVAELEKRYSHLRKNIKLSEFAHNIDMAEIMQEYRKRADELTNNEPFVIINTLMNGKGILPTLVEMEMQAKETYKNNIFSKLGSTGILDRKGNTAQYFNEDQEYEYYEILQSYQFSVEFSSCNLIREIIFAGIQKGKLSTHTFLSFLQQHSWLGKELEMSTNGGKPIPYCWLALIAPSLNEYFVNLEFYFKNQSNFPNFVLCIDSLSLKIEGMLRDICEFKGITTFEFKPDKKGRTISQEKDIHKLLYEPEIVKLIDKDDLLFFKFLLVEKAGYNLRHRIAHSLMTYYEYHINLMNLLIMAVLKFGKYNFVSTKK